MQVSHVRTYFDPDAIEFCNVGERLDCVSVALSRASVLLNVPVAFWGIVGFTLLLFALRRRPPLVLPLALAAALATTALLIVEIVVIRSLCLFCEAVHLITLWLLYLAWRQRDLPATFTYLRSPRALARDLAAPALVLACAAVFTPRYWMISTWKGGSQYPSGVTEDGFRWIGAAEPTVVVHEFVDYACPHCALATSRMYMVLGRHPDELRIVRHMWPRMRCLPVTAKRCEYARAALCAGDVGKFWEMESWLFDHIPGAPRWSPEDAAADLGLDAEALAACMDDPATFERAEFESKYARKLKLDGTPGYTLDGEKRSPAQVHAALRERLGPLW
ncbi:MAG: thioredoxin domain-containing protein [Myxococcales bacterium]|nr:thioredoxin domain-containing protein [Myxococcales bacterium]